MIADGPHVAARDAVLRGLGRSTSPCCAALLTWWQRSEGTLSVHSITTARRERFYWATVLLTFGLGTALGDTTAINMGLGFAWSIVLFGVLILVPLALWRLGLNATIAFWASYVLTRPLGASVADWLGKPPSHGGLGWGDGPVFGLGLALFAALVAYLAITPRRRRGRPPGSPGGAGRAPGPGAGLRDGLTCSEPAPDEVRDGFEAGGGGGI